VVEGGGPFEYRAGSAPENLGGMSQPQKEGAAFDNQFCLFSGPTTSYLAWQDHISCPQAKKRKTFPTMENKLSSRRN